MLQKSVLIALTAGLLAALPTINAQPADQPKPIRISMAKTFFHDQPMVFVELAAYEFKEVMRKATELNGEVTVTYSAAEIADKLEGKQLDFAILYAHEFARAQQKYPDLQPILIAATKQQDKRVHVIVHKDSTAKTFDDLRGKTLDLPAGTKEYCRIYLDKLCIDRAQAGPARFFGTIAKSATYIEALNQVARNEANATIVDSLWLDAYKEVRGPVFAKNLRILQQSEVVPPAVVVYKKGALPQATVDTIRNGLLKAHAGMRGRDLMNLWSIDAFESVPKDYAKSLESMLKEYPTSVLPR